MFPRILRTGIALAAVVLLAGLVWLVVGLYIPQVLPAGEVIFEIERGTGMSAVARSLADQGLIRSRPAFLAGYHLFFYPRAIKAGEYSLSSPARAKEVLDMLVKGRVLLHAVTIPEGMTGQEIGPLIAPLLAEGAEGFAAVFRDPGIIAGLDPKATNLEGYLFPETYSFAKGVAAEEAVGAMVGQFRKVFEGLWTARPARLRLSGREVVILASIIEKETSVAEEKSLVSAVFHNRLRLGMKLDCDPTIIYALKLRGTYDGRLGKKDMALDSPYNTYRYAGLPPGPICNPGGEALRAAFFPAEEEFIYFVSRNDGSHHFSRTFAEHQAAVRRYQKGAGGRS
jgi:UPF0755 protein